MRGSHTALGLVAALAIAPALGCGGTSDEGRPDAGVPDAGLPDAQVSTPLFPADYADTYVEVRDCRQNSGSHNFNRIRVLADPAALAPYRDRAGDFPAGAVVLKEEHAFEDSDCSGDVIRWTAMERLADPAANPDLLGWHWQDVAADRTVVSDDQPACYGCHTDCEGAEGYEGTCTDP